MLLQGTCMYLNTTSMIWQTDGCITDRQLSNTTSVTCTCEHLTMFTVFFSLSCATPSKALEILSWIGCILSILALSATLVMFVVIRQCRKTKENVNGISSSHSSSSQELRRRIMVRKLFSFRYKSFHCVRIWFYRLNHVDFQWSNRCCSYYVFY